MDDSKVECYQCGAENLWGSQFCSKCGWKLGKRPGQEVEKKPSDGSARRDFIIAVIAIILGTMLVVGIYRQFFAGPLPLSP